MAFIIGGPVTAVPTMVLFWTFFKKRVFALYMFICLSGTMLIAYTFQFLVFVPGVDLGNALLKGVGSLSGGTSSIIEKHDPNVRMVMDPAGKGVVATYTNDADGRGPIVFDASRDRFAGASADRCDNRHYIFNVAEWLDQNSNSAAQKSILVYTLSEGIAGDSSLLGDGVLAELGSRGFKVRLASRRDTPRITERLLAGYGQLWLFFGPHGVNGLSDGEVKLITDYNAKGAAALIVPAGVRTDGNGDEEANRLSSRYGVRFAGIVENRKELHVSSASSVLTQTAEWLGSFLKMVKKA